MMVLVANEIHHFRRVSMETKPLLSKTLLLVIYLSVTWSPNAGDDVGIPQRAAGDYLHLNCRINASHDERGTTVTRREGELQVTLLRLTSPNYPNNYPNRSECLEVIEAPRDHRIRLDFREDFHLEASAVCDFDYVELRDGPFGFSPLLGRYCGNQRPPVIESSGRFLWLKFQSDDYIEYQGFQAVYEFFTLDSEEGRNASSYAQSTESEISDNDVCRIVVDTSEHEGILSHLDIPSAFLQRSNHSALPIDCTWLLYSPPSNRVFLRWVVYEMPSPHSCEDSRLSVYERTTAQTDRRRVFCGAIARDLQLTSNRVYLRLFSSSTSLLPSFRIVFTIFRHGPCPAWLFHCGDNTCIRKSLVCNGQANCNYSRDEAKCGSNAQTTPTAIPLSASIQTLAVAMVTGAIITIVVVVCVIACRQRHQEARLRRHALKQEARQADEAGLLTLASSNEWTHKDRGNAAPTFRQNRPEAKSTGTVPSVDLHGPLLTPYVAKPPVGNYPHGRRGDPCLKPTSAVLMTESETEEMEARRLTFDIAEVRWCRDKPQSRSCDDHLDTSGLAKPASGPDVIVGRSRNAPRESPGQTGSYSLEPITIAGETTFPVRPEVTSGIRLRDPLGAYLTLRGGQVTFGALRVGIDPREISFGGSSDELPVSHRKNTVTKSSRQNEATYRYHDDMPVCSAVLRSMPPHPVETGNEWTKKAPVVTNRK